MAYDGEAGRQPPAASGLATAVQAHLGRASRFVDGKTRNWSLFFFFRVLSKARLAANLKQIALALDAKAAAGVAPAKLDDPQAPAQLFLDWLKVLVDAKSDDFWKTFRTECEKAGIQVPAASRPRPGGVRVPLPGHRGLFEGCIRPVAGKLHHADQGRRCACGLRHAFEPRQLQCLRGEVRQYRRCRGAQGVVGWPPGSVRLRTFRQFAPAQAGPKDGVVRPAVLRSEAVETGLKRDRDQVEKQWDPVPINFAFTFPGLKALQLSEPTLASFPEPFKQGMAARAERLGDIGPSAPENWEGVLGSDGGTLSTPGATMEQCSVVTYGRRPNS